MGPGESDTPVPPPTKGLYLATAAEIAAAPTSSGALGTAFISGAATALPLVGTAFEKINFDPAVFGDITGPKTAGASPKVRPLTLVVKVSDDTLFSYGDPADRGAAALAATHGAITILAADGWVAIPVQHDVVSQSSNMWVGATNAATTIQYYVLGV